MFDFERGYPFLILSNTDYLMYFGFSCLFSLIALILFFFYLILLGKYTCLIIIGACWVEKVIATTIKVVRPLWQFVFLFNYYFSLIINFIKIRVKDMKLDLGLYPCYSQSTLFYLFIYS